MAMPTAPRGATMLMRRSSGSSVTPTATVMWTTPTSSRSRPRTAKSSGQGGYQPFFDFNGDGTINTVDFAEVKQRYGKRI